MVVTEGDTIKNPPTPVHVTAGFTFDGWYTSMTMNESTKFDFNTPITSNRRLYAKWTQNAANTYTITFNANGGTIEGGQTTWEQQVNGGQKINQENMPVMTREGWTFSGKWYTDEDCTIVFDMDGAINAGRVLYAGWTQKTDGGEKDGVSSWVFIVIGCVAGAALLSAAVLIVLKKRRKI